MTEIPKRLDRKLVYGDHYLSHFADRISLPDGQIVERYNVIEFPADSVGAIILDDQDRVLMIKVARYPTKRVELEIPAGSLNLNEEVNSGAQREVHEETGYETGDFELVCDYYPLNDISPKKVTIVKGRVKHGSSGITNSKVVGVIWLSKEELIAKLASNELKDSLTIIGLFYLLLARKEK